MPVCKKTGPMQRRTPVLIADEQQPTRQVLRAMLASWPQGGVVGEAADGQEAVNLVAEWRPDVVRIDIHMPV